MIRLQLRSEFKQRSTQWIARSHTEHDHNDYSGQSKSNAKQAIQKLNRKAGRQNGFTLAELIVAMLIASITVTAGVKLSQTVVDNSRKSQQNEQAVRLADITIDQIQQEIRNGEELVDVESELPTGCNGYQTAGIEFLFAVDIPDQAMSLDDYDISKGSPKLTTVKCPIVYGTKLTSEGRTLYRIGPEISEKGYYDPTTENTSVVLEGIHTTQQTSVNQQSLKQQCTTPKWKYIEQGGMAVCIDQRMKRMAKLAITMKADGAALTAQPSTHRQGGAMTELLSSEATASGGNPSKCKAGSGCNLKGQPISCDKTSFMIDTSGSMGWYGGRRLAAAKRDLLKAIDMCSDVAEINVTAWSSRGYFEKKVFNSPQKLTSANRNILKREILGFRAYGGTDPWRDLDKAIQDQNVKEIVILSDGETWPYPYGYKSIGPLYCGYTQYADCYKRYNDNYRSSNPVVIKSVSVDLNFCGNGWMGKLADLNGGSCIVSN